MFISSKLARLEKENAVLREQQSSDRKSHEIQLNALRGEKDNAITAGIAEKTVELVSANALLLVKQSEEHTKRFEDFVTAIAERLDNNTGEALEAVQEMAKQYKSEVVLKETVVGSSTNNVS